MVKILILISLMALLLFSGCEPRKPFIINETNVLINNYTYTQNNSEGFKTCEVQIYEYNKTTQLYSDIGIRNITNCYKEIGETIN